ncbi:MAG: AMP-dependent synthetase [Calditrichaeota bacterium]|nr:MAG: AMP-dependent synthetase [Calditrichota bacterium]
MSQSFAISETFPFDQQIVWQPNPKWMAESNLQRFMDRHGIPDYDRLYRRSIEDIAWFWEAVLEDLGIEFYEPYEQIVDLSQGIQFPRWCVGGKLNIVHNCLDKWQNTPTRDRIALRWEGEEGSTRLYTYRELYEQVNRCANALRELGLGKGDPIGLYMPMIPELAIAFLAIVKIGGVLLPLFSGYGPSAISTRLKDAGARALFTTDGAFRRGKTVPMKATADEALKEVPSVEHVIVVNRVGLSDLPWKEGRDHRWEELVPRQSPEAETERTDAEDTVMIIYTSGTTGRPKGAVHTHCGFPIKSAQDMYHPMDVKPEDTMYWMTDMGWMMGPWEVFGTLLIGATMVFYDGAPDYPDVDRVWQLAADHRVTHLGVSPTLIRSLKAHGADPVRKHDLSGLRAVGSTGSPWDPESWLWLFHTVLNGEKPILNYSGGTEISGGIVCGNFFKPLKPCAFSGPVVGMDADVVDEDGRPVRGAVGELILRKPWIGMTRGFWRDRQRYLDTYWSRWENVWVHGDFAAIDEDGLWYILGRSDDTIKVAGKRLGPAEVEAIINGHEAVLESAAIAVPHPVKDNEVVVFCVLRPGYSPTEELRRELMERITEELGKPLKPKEIKFTTALPKTRNAKIMRRVIRAAYLGEDPGDVSSLEDPATVEAIRQAQ